MYSGKKISFFIACIVILLASSCPANGRTVSGITKGSLSRYTYVTDTDLTISGTLNGDDLGWLRNLVKNYSLVSIDLSNVNIVKGGTVGDTYRYEWSGSYGEYEEPRDIVNEEDDVIPAGMFCDCTKLQYIKLPYSTKKISYRAFYNCSALTTTGMNFYDAYLTEIGEEAYARCGSLQTIMIPRTVEEIGLASFYNCVNLTTVQQDVDGSTGLKRISDEAFMGCSKLKSFNVPENVTNLGGYSHLGHANHDQGVFAYCRALESVYMSGDIRVQGKAFNGCTALKTVKTGQYVSSWCSISFEDPLGNPTYYSHSLTFETPGPSSLQNLVIPETVTSLSRYAFVNCENITSVEFPASIKSIGSDAFMGCSNLEEIRIKSLEGWMAMNFGNSYEYVPVRDSYGNIAYAYDSEDGDYQICKGVASACSPMRYAKRFYVNGELLENLIIPDGVTSIGSAAFANIPHLRSVTFPAGLTSVGVLAFENCNNIETVSASSQKEWDNIQFKELYVSQGNVILGEKDADGYYDPDYKSVYVASSNPTIYGAKLLFRNVELVDGADYSGDECISLESLSFTKTFSASATGNWNALYVPMSVDVEEYAGDLDFAEIYAFCATVDTNGDGAVDADDENFLFVRPVKTGCILPNLPYLVRPREAKTYVINSADNVLYPATNGRVEFSTTRDRYTVTGLNESFTAVAGDNNYYVSATGKLSTRVTGSTTVKANRWIMHRESTQYGGSSDNGSGAKEYRIIAIGEDINETDAINVIKASQDNDIPAGLYTIDGRKLNDSANLPSGVYIKNGKKIIIKL